MGMTAAMERMITTMVDMEIMMVLTKMEVTIDEMNDYSSLMLNKYFVETILHYYTL